MLCDLSSFTKHSWNLCLEKCVPGKCDADLPGDYDNAGHKIIQQLLR